MMLSHSVMYYKAHRRDDQSGCWSFSRLLANVYDFRIFTHKHNIMRTNIALDDMLVQQAIQLSKLRTKKEVVQEALKHYISWMKKKQLLDVRGKLTWEGKLKEMRSQ